MAVALERIEGFVVGVESGEARSLAIVSRPVKANVCASMTRSRGSIERAVAAVTSDNRNSSESSPALKRRSASDKLIGIGSPFASRGVTRERSYEECAFLGNDKTVRFAIETDNGRATSEATCSNAYL